MYEQQLIRELKQDAIKLARERGQVSPYNNARDIIASKVEHHARKFLSRPNERSARVLEELTGASVDFQQSDFGEPITNQE